MPCVTLDTTKMQQVFVNLFMNAIHAMPEGGTLTVRTYARRLTKIERETARDEGSRQAERFRVGDEVVIAEVDDTGSGIPPDKLSKYGIPSSPPSRQAAARDWGCRSRGRSSNCTTAMITISNRDAGGLRVTLMFHAAARCRGAG